MKLPANLHNMDRMQKKENQDQPPYSGGGQNIPFLYEVAEAAFMFPAEKGTDAPLELPSES